MHRAVFYGNLIKMILLLNLYRLIFEEAVGAIVLSVHRDDDLLTGAARCEGPRRKAKTYEKQAEKEHDISLVDDFEHKNSNKV